MAKETAKNGDTNRLVSKEELKMEDSKLVSRIEKLQSEITAEIDVLKVHIRDMLSHRQQQEESNSKILSELHQMNELLEKLNQEHQYTQRIIQNHEKSLEENRRIIRKIEKELQKIKSVLRVD